MKKTPKLVSVFLLAIGFSFGCGEDSSSSTPAVDAGVNDATAETDGTLPDATIEPECQADEDCDADSFCEVMSDNQAMCRVGCREGGCEMGRMCDTEARVCVRDESCESDANCYFAEYCNEGVCTDGCRLDDPDSCPRDEEGFPRACDERSRTCVRQAVCCDEENACFLEFPDLCADIVEGERGCFNPNPCEGRCAGDAECAEGEFCDLTVGECAEGCRFGAENEGDSCTEGRICNPETRLCVRPPCTEDAECEADYFCAIDVCIEGCRYTYGIDDETGAQIITDPRGNCANPTHICPASRICQEPDNTCFRDLDCVLALDQVGAYCDLGECKAPCLGHDDCDCIDTPDYTCTEEEVAEAATKACILSRCQVGCRDDDSEPNDTIETATVVTFADPLSSGELGPFMACDGNPVPNVDYYQFSVPAVGMTVIAHAYFTHADGDIDIALIRPDGSEVDADNSETADQEPDEGPKCRTQGTSCTDNETIVVPSTAAARNAAGEWQLKVRSRGIDRNEYRIAIEFNEGTGPDGAEVDDTPAEATVLDLPGIDDQTLIEYRTIHLVDDGEAADEDWFRLDLNTPETFEFGDGFELELQVLGNDTGMNQDLEIEVFQQATVDEMTECLFDGSAPIEGLCPVFVQSLAGNTDPSLGPITHIRRLPRNNNVVNGPVYFRVRGFSVDDISRYRLNVMVSRYMPYCFTDALEPNATRETAYNLMTRVDFTRPGTDGTLELRPGDLRLSGLSACGLEEDWFRFDLREGDGVSVRMERMAMNHALGQMGDTTIELFDENGTLMPTPFGRSDAIENVVRLPADSAAAGTYFVKVVPNSDTDNDPPEFLVRTNYDLVVNRAPGAVECLPDTFDELNPNDLGGNATLLMPGSSPNLTLCGADLDVDWYRFELSEESTIELNLEFDHRQGNLDLLLYYEPFIDPITNDILTTTEVEEVVTDNDGNPQIVTRVVRNDPLNDQQGRINNVAAEVDDERIILENQAPGTYYVKVRGTSRPTVNYGLTLSLEERQYLCQPMLGNGDLGQASTLSGSAEVLDDEYLCYRPLPGDWANYTLPVDGQLDLTISTHFNPDRGKVYLNLLNADTMMVATTQEFVATESGTHCIELDTSEQGLFYIQVLPWSIQTADETLDFDLRIGDTGDCLDVVPFVDQPYGAVQSYEQ